MKEIWKDVVGYEGLYKVSNFGNVLTLPKIREVLYKKGIHKGKLVKHTGFKEPYMMTPRKDNFSRRPGGKLYSRLLVPLRKDGKRKMWKIHRLVATAFIENPEGKKTVNHKDNNPLNNYVDNLEWMTNKENCQYRFKQKS